MEDIAISRGCYTKQTLMTATQQYPLSPNPDRLYVIVSSPFVAGNHVGVYTNSSDVAGGRAIVGVWIDVTAGQAGIGYNYAVLSYKEHGPIVFGSLICYCSSAPSIMTEVLMGADLSRWTHLFTKQKRDEYTRRG
jgi:hypothetical protein